MSGILSASRPLENVHLNASLLPGVCSYTFSVPLDTQPTTLSWTMRDNKQEALTAVDRFWLTPLNI